MKAINYIYAFLFILKEIIKIFKFGLIFNSLTSWMLNFSLTFLACNENPVLKIHTKSHSIQQNVHLSLNLRRNSSKWTRPHISKLVVADMKVG